MPDESAADDGESSDDDVSQLRDIVAKQHSRINHLEQQVAALDEEPTIGRRGIVGTIAAAVGLGGFAGYGSQHASAQASGPGGQQGTPEEPNDMFAWDLDVQNGATFNGNPLTGVGELDVESLVNDYHYAGAFDGSSPDDRLDNAINAASPGDAIYLENVDYESDRTISKRLSFVASGPFGQGGPPRIFNAVWTADVEVNIRNFRISGSTGGLILEGGFSNISNIVNTAEITVGGDNSILTGVHGGDVTFASGTSGSIIDSSTDVTITDNGTNTVGDIA